MPKSTPWNLVLVATVGTLLTAPAMYLGWPDLGHDSVDHARWVEQFSAQLRSGEWYPRWLTASNGGLGGPVFFYYPPMAEYLAAPFLSLWRPGRAGAWHGIGLASEFVLIASGIFAYFWLRRWAGTRGALLGAIAYMLVPWHTAIELYNAGSWSGVCGFMWIPLALLGIDRLIDARRGAFLLIAIAYSLLVLTNLPTAILVSLLLPTYSLFLALRDSRIRRAFQTGCAMLLGLGIAAAYLFPGVLLQDAGFSYILRAAGGFYDYHKWFLGADIHSIRDYKLRVLVVSVSMLAAAAGGYYLSRSVYSRGPNRKRMLFWLGVAAVCLFFMTPLSVFLWSSIRPLATLEGPPRFNTILAVAVAVLWAGAAPALSQSRSRWPVLLACSFGFLWLGGTCWAASRAFLAWRSDPKGVERLEEGERLREERPEFQPRWASTVMHQGVERLIARLPGRALRLESPLGEPMSGSTSIVSWQPRRAILKLENTQPGRLLVGQFYYPGWQARDLKDQQFLPVSASNPDGFLSVEVPAGTHQIVLQLEAESPERAGLAVSGVSCVLACIIGLVSALRRTDQTTRTERALTVTDHG